MAWDLKFVKIIPTETKYLPGPTEASLFSQDQGLRERSQAPMAAKQEKHELLNVFNIIMQFLPLSKPFLSTLCLSCTMLFRVYK